VAFATIHKALRPRVAPNMPSYEPDPVLIFEHQTLYPMEGELPAGAGPVDLRRAAIRRPGSDLAIVTYGASVYKAIAAADRLAAEGVSAEVIDLRVLRPLDTETILASATRTRRVLVVDEGWRSGGISAEISARIHEQAFYELDRPVARVCTAEVPIPYARHLEEAALPQEEAILAAARALVSTHG
jgi:pyruvate/2-oxoglutarate/acetoin dehydrogenase E1 component